MGKFLIAIIAFLIPAAIIINQWQAGRYKDFQKIARETTGQVIFSEEKVFDSKNNRKEYVVEYQFEVDGVSYEGSDKVEFYDMRESFALGTNVAVFYDPKNPRRNHLKALLERRIG